MNARRLTAAMAIPCLCLVAVSAQAQTRRAITPQPANFDIRQLPQEDAPRLQPVEAPPAEPSTGMLESWTVGENSHFGIGRFRVGEIARSRTNTERMRNNPMDRENRAIAGAGIRVIFD